MEGYFHTYTSQIQCIFLRLSDHYSRYLPRHQGQARLTRIPGNKRRDDVTIDTACQFMTANQIDSDKLRTMFIQMTVCKWLCL